MKVYLSGKISGLTEAEYKENFYKAGCKIIELFPIIEKHYYSMVVNPLEIKPLFGIKKWLFYMVADIWQLRKCSHIEQCNKIGLKAKGLAWNIFTQSLY